MEWALAACLFNKMNRLIDAVATLVNDTHVAVAIPYAHVPRLLINKLNLQQLRAIGSGLQSVNK